MTLAVPLLAALALVAGTVALVAYRRPKAALAFLSRRGLKKAGARFAFADGPRGRIGYWTVGSGPPLALLHGAGDQAGTWVQLVPGLAARFRLLLIDFPGHQRSAPASGPIHHGDMADALAAVLDRAAPPDRDGGGKVVLVGNSMGGWAALLYAHRHPERVAALVLEDSGGISGPDLAADLSPRSRDEARRLLRRTFGPALPEVKSHVLDDLLRRTRTGPIARLLGSHVTPFLLDGRLATVTAPAHLVWGEHDGLLPLDYAERLAAELPRSRLHVLADCGHIPHLQRPEAFRQVLDTILADPEGALDG